MQQGQGIVVCLVALCTLPCIAKAGSWQVTGVLSAAPAAASNSTCHGGSASSEAAYDTPHSALQLLGFLCNRTVLVAQGCVALGSNYMDDGQIMVKLQFFQAAKPFLLLDKLQQLQVSCPVRILHGVLVGAQDSAGLLS
jgi:hypothetical protein